VILSTTRWLYSISVKFIRTSLYFGNDSKLWKIVKYVYVSFRGATFLKELKGLLFSGRCSPREISKISNEPFPKYRGWRQTQWTSYIYTYEMPNTFFKALKESCIISVECETIYIYIYIYIYVYTYIHIHIYVYILIIKYRRKILILDFYILDILFNFIYYFNINIFDSYILTTQLISTIYFQIIYR